MDGTHLSDKEAPDPEAERKRVDDALTDQGREAELESTVEDVPGAPTWPIPAASHEDTPPSLPDGMNWEIVARQLGVERRVLEHDGAIVLVGEYFPESGFFLDPSTMRGRHVDVGDIALRAGYLVGDMTVSEFEVSVSVEEAIAATGKPVIPEQVGPIVAVFPNALLAGRAKSRILRGSLGTGVTSETGTPGVTLSVKYPELGGRVASVMAANGGVLISAGGRPLVPSVGILSTDSSLTGGAGFSGDLGDQSRPGTGVTGDSEGTEVNNRGAEVVDGTEFRPV